MSGTVSRRRRWAGIAVGATFVAGLASFPGGAVAVISDNGSPPVTQPHGVLRLHLGADANRFSYEPLSGQATGPQSISINNKCIVSLETTPDRFAALSAIGGISAETPDGVAADVGFAPYGIGAKYSEGKGTSCGRVDADQSLTLSLAGSLAGKAITEAQLDIEGKFDVVVQADLYRSGQYIDTISLEDPAFSDNGPDAGLKDNVRWLIQTDLLASTPAIPEPFDAMVLTPMGGVGSFSLEGGADGTPPVGTAPAPDGTPLIDETSDSLFAISTFYGDQLDCDEQITSSGEGITFTITRINTGLCTEDVPYDVTFSRDGTNQTVNLLKDESVVDGQSAEFLVKIVWAPEPAVTPIPATLITVPGFPETEAEWCNPGPALWDTDPPFFPWCLTAQSAVIVGSQTAPDNLMQVTDDYYGKLDPAFSRR